MFIERIANTAFSSIGAASVWRTCRSDGAKSYVYWHFYKHAAPQKPHAFAGWGRVNFTSSRHAATG
ncbi:MAG: hypothetical protein AAB401_12195, partial [Acidobacteriota bacterium]